MTAVIEFFIPLEDLPAAGQIAHQQHNRHKRNGEEDEIRQQLLLYPGIAVEELQSLVAAAFQCTACGFETASGALVPTSVLCARPDLFADKALRVLTSETADEDASELLPDDGSSSTPAMWTGGGSMPAPVTEAWSASRQWSEDTGFEADEEDLDGSMSSDREADAPALDLGEVSLSVNELLPLVALCYHLRSVHMEDALLVFRLLESKDGLLPRSRFDAGVRKLVSLAKPNKNIATSLVKSLASLFSILDPNGTGVVNSDDVLACISLFVDNNKHKKLYVSFMVFDADQDGRLRPAEAFRFVHSFLLTVLAMCASQSPIDEFISDRLADAAGDMAEKAVIELFHSAHLADPNFVSFPEFVAFVAAFPSLIPCFAVLEFIEGAVGTLAQEPGDAYDDGEDEVAIELPANVGVPDMDSGYETDNEASEALTPAEKQTRLRLAREEAQRQAHLHDPGVLLHVSGSSIHPEDHMLRVERGEVDEFAEAWRSSNLSNVELAHILDVFADEAHDDMLDVHSFQRCMERLMGDVNDVNPVHRERLGASLANLFRIFDIDNNGWVDAVEFTVGFTIMCSGSLEEKLQLSFNLFDQDRDGYISRLEMFQFLYAYLCACVALKGDEASSHLDSESARDALTQLTLQKTRHFFQLADEDHDGLISFSEFYTAFQRYRHVLPWMHVMDVMVEDDDAGDDVDEEEILADEVLARVPVLSEAAPKHARDHSGTLVHSDTQQLLSITHKDLEDMHTVRQHLGGLDPQDLVQVFVSHSHDNQLDKEGFAAAVTQVVPMSAEGDLDPHKLTREELEESRRLLGHLLGNLFSLFDVHQTGQVDVNEFIAAVVVLTEADPEQKLALAFMMVDRNRDGFLSPHELRSFLRSFLSVIFGVNTGVRHMSAADADHLRGVISRVAAAHTTELLELADTDHDGQLSFGEFARVASDHPNLLPWLDVLDHLSAPSRVAPPADDVDSWSEDGDRATLMHFLRVQSALDGVDAAVIRRVFFRRVDERTSLSRTDYQDAWDELLGEQLEGEATLMAILSNCFTIFDVDETETVNARELLAGTQFLCARPLRMRMAAAWMLLDLDMDGMLSMAEFFQYASSILRVLMALRDTEPLDDETMDELSTGIDVSARQATIEIFQRATLSEDKHISFTEFERVFYEDRSVLPWLSFLEQAEQAEQEATEEEEESPDAVLMSVPLSLDHVQSVPIRRCDLQLLELLMEEFSDVSMEMLFDVLEARATETDAYQVVSRRVFDEAMSELLPSLYSQGTRGKLLRDSLNSIWLVLDHNESDHVDMVDLTLCLALLCSSHEDLYLGFAFMVLDEDEDRCLRSTELARLIAAFLSLLLALNADMRRVDVAHMQSMVAVGSVTLTRDFFAAAASDSAVDVISYETFCELYQSQPDLLPWLNVMSLLAQSSLGTGGLAVVGSSIAQTPTGTRVRSRAEPEEEDGAEDDVAVALQYEEPGYKNEVLEVVDLLTGRSYSLTSDNMFTLIRMQLPRQSHADLVGACQRVLGSGQPLVGSELTPAQFAHLVQLVSHTSVLEPDVSPYFGSLFSILADEEANTADTLEVLSALAALVGGQSKLERLELMFDVADYDRTGTLSLNELVKYARAFLALQLAVSDTYSDLPASMLHSMSRQAAGTAAHEILRQADANRDGVVGLGEFIAASQDLPDLMPWLRVLDYLPSEEHGVVQVVAENGLPGDEQFSYDKVAHVLRELRGLGLGSLSTPDMVDAFVRASEDEVLYRPRFEQAILLLLSERLGLAGNELQAAVRSVSRLFDAFDLNGDGAVDLREFLCGMFMFCDDNSEDILRQAFQLFDENGDGMLSKKELTSYINAFLHAMTLLSMDDSAAPHLSREVAAAALAAAQRSVNDIFEVADLDHDSRLSWEEFLRASQESGPLRPWLRLMSLV